MTKVESFGKSYESSKIESKWRQSWIEKNFYKAKKNKAKKPYTILMPPPNITGDLTMGHMMYTLQDILIRWHRAKGFEACWIPGIDHASIATEAKVTKLLEEKGLSKKQIGREAFLKHAMDWKEKYGTRIMESLQLLGISCDWSRHIFTMDKEYSQSVIKAIVLLYKDGLVYQNKKLVNWCP
ncbi:MAG: class I tRNA ligase family protein, partial [Silvanigrellaceae bacterium]|nr:class I tRNA ligase family protein [Silvanigrellaceae bacterium]